VAGLVYFRKDFEDSTVVRYAFGGDPGEFSRKLTMDKGSRACVVEDGVVEVNTVAFES